MGEAASAARGYRLTDESVSSWFRSFYLGLTSDNIVRFPYADMSDFEIPFSFRTDAPMADAVSSQIFEACIRPCLLPVGIGSGRTHRSSYEFYHPSVGARQMGFGQLPIGLYFIDKIKARQPIGSALEFDRIMHLGEDLPLGTCSDIFLTPSSSRLFTQWWSEWKKHLFWANPTRYASVPDSEDEVQLLLLFFSFSVYSYRLWMNHHFYPCMSLQGPDRDPPTESNSGRPIQYGPPSATPILGADAPSVSALMKGRSAVSKRAASKPKRVAVKKRRIAHPTTQPPSSAPTPPVITSTEPMIGLAQAAETTKATEPIIATASEPTIQVKSILFPALRFI